MTANQTQQTNFTREPSEAKWGGFQAGDTPEPGLDAGTHLAYLRPDWRTVAGPYGPAVKLYYNIFIEGRTGLRTFIQSELCNESFALGSKLIRRMSAANNKTYDETTDLSKEPNEGWVLVNLVRSQDGKYLNIGDVLALPRNYKTPTIGDPASAHLGGTIGNVDNVPF